MKKLFNQNSRGQWVKKIDTETEGRKESGLFDPGHMLLVIYMTLLCAILLIGGFADG